MKKMGSIKFYNDINLNIKFNFDDLCHHLFKKRMLTKGKTDEDVVKENLIDFYDRTSEKVEYTKR